MKQKQGTALSVFLLILCVFFWLQSRVFSNEQVSKPFQYSGYSSPQWEGFTRTAAYVPMPDGVKIAVDAFLPSGFKGEGKAPTKFPVIMQYTPYHRSMFDPKGGQFLLSPVQKLYLSLGYAYVGVDMRGTGGSFGWKMIMDPIIREDGKRIIDWIASQPWSDGNVGMEGGSYVGWSQLACASQSPEALKCIVPNEAGFDGFMMFPGGIYSYAFLQYWSGMMYYINRNAVPTFWVPIAPVPPVIDEDGDGELVDEIPVDKNGQWSFSDDYAWPVDPDNPPEYSDGAARKDHFYFNAVMEHVAHPDGAPGTFDADSLVGKIMFWDAKFPRGGLIESDLNFSFLPDIMKSKIPVYNVGGWFDPFVRNTFELYSTMKGTNPSRIMIRPVYHQGISAPFAELLGIEDWNPADPFMYQQLATESLRWYDRWLKGIENGVDKEQPVLIYVMNGGGWRQEDDWPLQRQSLTKFYFDKGKKLIREDIRKVRKKGKDKYKADFSHNSGWGPDEDMNWLAKVNALSGKPAPASLVFYHNRQQMFIPAETPPMRTEKDKQCLTYTTAPLEEDTEVTGHPVLQVWVSSTADYGDFFFYLEDVDESGEAVLVTEYGHRAGFKKLVDNNEMIPNNPGIDILPDLPWHGFKKSDYTDRVFADKAIVKIVRDLYPTSWVFKKGHRIRVSIACADWPTFRLHPKLSPANNPDDKNNIIPKITVHRDKDHPSHIELPIISR